MLSNPDLQLRKISEPFGLPLHQFPRLNFHGMRIAQPDDKYITCDLVSHHLLDQRMPEERGYWPIVPRSCNVRGRTKSHRARVPTDANGASRLRISRHTANPKPARGPNRSRSEADVSESIEPR